MQEKNSQPKNAEVIQTETDLDYHCSENIESFSKSNVSDSSSVYSLNSIHYNFFSFSFQKLNHENFLGGAHP